MSPLDPDALDKARDGTGSLMPRNEWREQFCLVLLSQPHQLRKEGEANTRSQDWDVAARRMEDNGPSGEMIKRRLRHVPYIKEDQEAPIQVNEKLTTLA